MTKMAMMAFGNGKVYEGEDAFVQLFRDKPESVKKAWHKRLKEYKDSLPRLDIDPTDI